MSRRGVRRQRPHVGGPDLRPRRRVRHRPRLRDARHALVAGRHGAAERLRGWSPASRSPGRRRRSSDRSPRDSLRRRRPTAVRHGRRPPRGERGRRSCTPMRDAELRARDAQRRDDAVPREAPSRRVSVHALEGIRFRALPDPAGRDLARPVRGPLRWRDRPAAGNRRGAARRGPVGLGWLRAAVGIGAAAVTLVLTVRPVTRHVGTHARLGRAVRRRHHRARPHHELRGGMDRPRGPLGRRRGERVHPGHAGAARTARQARDVLAVEMVFIGASNELGAFESGVVGRLWALRSRSCSAVRRRSGSHCCGPRCSRRSGRPTASPSPSTERTRARR